MVMVVKRNNFSKFNVGDFLINSMLFWKNRAKESNYLFSKNMLYRISFNNYS